MGHGTWDIECLTLVTFRSFEKLWVGGGGGGGVGL